MNILSFAYHDFHRGFLEAAADKIRTENPAYKDLNHFGETDFRNVPEKLAQTNPALIVLDFSWIEFAGDLGNHIKENNTPVLLVKAGGFDNKHRNLPKDCFVTAIQPSALTSPAIVPVIVNIFEHAASGKSHEDFQAHISGLIDKTEPDIQFGLEAVRWQSTIRAVRAINDVPPHPTASAWS